MAYVHCMADLCISICNEIATRGFHGSSIEAIKLLKGKAFYMKYIDEKRKLDISSLSEDVKKEQLGKCFQPNMKAIGFLGEALDEGFLDDEGSYMLDRAMMDCIFEANMLDICNRCFLCRKKLQGKEKLIKSHVIPHAILDIMSPEKTGDKQTIYSSKTAIKKASSRLLAPGEMVYYMLCHNCEGVVSVNGETQFSPHFFQKIYDKQEDVSFDRATKEQWIEYGPWLHQFCVTLIFRAMHWSTDKYLNDDVIYATFKQCRSCINSWPCGRGDQASSLKIYIFVSPLSVGDHEKMQHKYLNWLLRSSLSSRFGSFDSNTSLILTPSFFVITLGLVSVLLSFDHLDAERFDRFIVDPSGGSFWVPPQSARKENIPSALWDLYVNVSASLGELVRTANPVFSFRDKKFQDREYSPDPTFIGSGMAAAAASSITEQITNLQVKEDHSLLPPQFSITSTPKKIKLPQEHRILLHSNYVRGRKSGSTFFIVVGKGRKYPINKPYVIWHFYEPTGTVTCGAFFSLSDLHVTDFLLSNKTLEYKAMSDRSLLTAKERMPTILKDLLEEKGFSSIFSLMHRVRTAHEAGRYLPPFDTKCGKDRQCWYCKLLCQNCCLNHAAYGRMSPGQHGMNIFCSESCQILSPGFLKDPPHVFVISSSEPLPSDIHVHCSPLSKSHQEIVHLYVRLLNKKNFPCEIEVAIYIGDGSDNFPLNRPYVVFYSHHLCHQLFVEFFINSELLAEEPLPKIANETSWNAVLQLNEANAVQKCLEKGGLLEVTLLQLSQLTIP